ncbi:MAG: FGGY family carbohydrate kinase [Armatimonadota bacterium]|nr:FGGY family carbohydrate kinase [Armatimonadota bacterium]
MSDYAYLGLDLGGTAVKAGVFGTSGEMLGFAGRSCGPVCSECLTPPQPSPKGGGGRAEVDIADIYAAARGATREAVSASGAEIGAMAISSQGQTFVSLDENDNPLHRAIIWYDSRAAEQADRLREAVGTEAPPLLIEAIAAGPKVMWLREANPELMRRARRFLLLPDYFTYRLTGEAVTDPTTAASTGLCADGEQGYYLPALAAAEIGEGELARILPSGTSVSTVRADVAREWGLSDKTRVVIGTNDQYAGALGAGNCEAGIVTETTGTCLALVTLTDKLPDPMQAGLLGGSFPIPGCWFVLAYAKTAGLVLDWFNREFCPGKTLKQLDEMAASSPIGSGGVTVLPHFDGMVSPEPNPNARGFICNLMLGNTVFDVYRAILEALSFSLRENIELLRDSGLHPDLIRSIGGGAKSDLWLQMKADVTGMSVERPRVTEAATLGAAMLAAVGAGEFRSVKECSQNLYKAEKVFVPDPGSRLEYDAAYEAYRGLCRKVYG